MSTSDMPALAPPPRRRAAYLFQVAALAVVYFLAAKLGLSFAFVAEQVTAVWPPTGIALAAVLLAGFRVWPGVWLGAFVANATANEPLLVAAGIATGNTLEAVAGAWLLRRVSGPDHSLQTVRGVLALVVLAAGVSTIVSATIGNLSLCLGGVHPWSRFTSLWKIWWLGDAMGDLLVAPALLAWSSRLQRPLRPEKFGEFGAFAFSTLAASVIIFAGLLPATINRSLEYLVFPFLIWGALRFRQVGSTFATLMVAAVAIVSTLYGRGPFAQPEVQTSLVLLLVFLGASALTGLTLGAMMAERRRVEDERLELLARAQEARAAAEEAVRQRDELVATVSHDLRTPLDAILGWTVMLRQGMVAEERSAHALETIERNALAQRQLIDDLMDISRMLGGRMRLHLNPIDVKHLVQSVGETLQPAAQAKEITVDLRVEPVPLMADSARLQQIVWNLVSNAIKFTPKGGRVVVEARRLDGEAVISVRDNGVGIDPSFVPHLFQRFRQADRGSVSERGGLGLGLAIVRHLVELHGGTVTASSEGEGKGALFVVKLPIAAPAAAELVGSGVAAGGAHSEVV